MPEQSKPEAVSSNAAIARDSPPPSEPAIIMESRYKKYGSVPAPDKLKFEYVSVDFGGGKQLPYINWFLILEKNIALQRAQAQNILGRAGVDLQKFDEIIKAKEDAGFQDEIYFALLLTQELNLAVSLISWAQQCSDQSARWIGAELAHVVQQSTFYWAEMRRHMDEPYLWRGGNLRQGEKVKQRKHNWTDEIQAAVVEILSAGGKATKETVAERLVVKDILLRKFSEPTVLYRMTNSGHHKPVKLDTLEKHISSIRAKIKRGEISLVRGKGNHQHQNSALDGRESTFDLKSNSNPYPWCACWPQQTAPTETCPSYAECARQMETVDAYKKFLALQGGEALSRLSLPKLQARQTDLIVDATEARFDVDHENSSPEATGK